MNEFTDLYAQICSFENLYLAYRKARKGKRGKSSGRGINPLTYANFR